MIVTSDDAHEISIKCIPTQLCYIYDIKSTQFVCFVVIPTIPTSQLFRNTLRGCMRMMSGITYDAAWYYHLVDYTINLLI